MPRNTHPSSYMDIKPILDTALAVGGASYRPRDKTGAHTSKAAIAWRARAYAFRNAIRVHQSTDGILGPPTTPYDSMVLRIDPADPTIVLINKVDPLGDLYDLSGNPLEIGPATPILLNEGADPLIEQARAQAIELGLED